MWRMAQTLPWEQRKEIIDECYICFLNHHVIKETEEPTKYKWKEWYVKKILSPSSTTMKEMIWMWSWNMAC